MKDVLRETGKLQEAERTLRWYAITNEVYPKPEVNGIDMDSFNTQTTGRIASILMMEDTPEKLQYLGLSPVGLILVAVLHWDYPVRLKQTEVLSIIEITIRLMLWADSMEQPI